MAQSKAAKARNWNTHPPIVAELVSDLEDLVVQATHERSHYYVKNCATRAVAVVKALATENAALKARLAKAPTDGATGQ